MMSLWITIAALSAIALIFLFWPLLRRRGELSTRLADEAGIVSEVNARLGENVRLFREHMAELDAQLANGRIDNAQYNQLKLEQERALLDDEASIRATLPRAGTKFGLKTFALVAALLMVSAWSLYESLGSSADVEVRHAQELKQKLDMEDVKAGRNPDPVRTRDLNRLIEARLAEEPNNLQYWFFLARNYMELNEFSKAVAAYQQVLERDKSSPTVMAELAQAMFLRDGRQTSPAVNELVEKALKADPDNTMALGLAGIDAYNKKNYVSAIKHWERVIKLVGEESPTGQSLSSGIEHALTLFLTNGGTLEELDAARRGREISVAIKLGEGVNATPDQVVFVYARAYQGAKMPLAIDRVNVSDLPSVVRLNESMAMTPAMSLASFDKVEIVARISTDGSATAKPGEWEGSVAPVDLTTAGPVIEVTIDRQVK